MGVRSYGVRNPTEMFDVYCFASEMQGKIFSCFLILCDLCSASSLAERSGEAEFYLFLGIRIMIVSNETMTYLR